MQYINREIAQRFESFLKLGKNIFLLGPRQTGKTTFLQQFPSDLYISLIKPKERLKYEKSPQILEEELHAYVRHHSIRNPFSEQPLVILDEIQVVPKLLDIIQFLIDERRAQFILTGSSARKLRRHSHAVNWLPGRVLFFRMDPFILTEFSQQPSLRELLWYGSMPGITMISDTELKTMELESYVHMYLEEEIRAEAAVRDVSVFLRFLELAAIESGNPVNFSKLSQDIGVSYKTIQGYYQILDDSLIVERIDPIIKSHARKKLTRANIYLFFDMGIRRVAAGEGPLEVAEHLGKLFQYFVGIELLRQARLSKKNIKLRFWRDPSGPEVDWVLECEQKYIPVEVKWTESPKAADAKHLHVFMKEYHCLKPGYIVCNIQRPRQLHSDIMAISWQQLPQIIHQIDL